MRYRVLVYAGLAFVLSRPAEAQKLQIALAAAADFTPVYAFVKNPGQYQGDHCPSRVRQREAERADGELFQGGRQSRHRR